MGLIWMSRRCAFFVNLVGWSVLPGKSDGSYQPSFLWSIIYRFGGVWVLCEIAGWCFVVSCHAESRFNVDLDAT